MPTLGVSHKRIDELREVLADMVGDDGADEALQKILAVFNYSLEQYAECHEKQLEAMKRCNQKKKQQGISTYNPNAYRKYYERNREEILRKNAEARRLRAASASASVA
jgi:uncharacterized protein YaiI (UPF0178 family)